MGARTPNAKDRRVQRTRELLHRAFIALILERGYDAVTIRDVVQRAGVGRSTFYTHFGDLEEFLLSHADERWMETIAVRGRAQRPFLGFTLPLLEHAQEYRRIWRALVGNKAGAALQKSFKKTLLRLIREDLVKVLPRQRPAVSEGTARYLAGAFCELLFWWLDSPGALSPAEVDALFHRLTRGAITSR